MVLVRLAFTSLKALATCPGKVTASEDPRLMAWVATARRFDGSHGAYRVEPEGEGSRVTIEARMKRSPLISLLMHFIKPKNKAPECHRPSEINIHPGSLVLWFR